MLKCWALDGEVRDSIRFVLEEERFTQSSLMPGSGGGGGLNYGSFQTWEWMKNIDWDIKLQNS